MILTASCKSDDRRESQNKAHHDQSGNSPRSDLDVAPAKPRPQFRDAPIALTIPVKVGLGLKDYYFDPVSGDDTAFGYFSAGVNISAPLAHGDIHGGVTFYGFGDALKSYNISEEKSAQVVGSVGFTLTF